VQFVAMTSEVVSRIEVAPAELGQTLQTVRLCPPEAQRQMQVSLSKLGQLTPVQVYRANGKLELIDGFKRLHAARSLSWPSLRAEVQHVDQVGAKVRLWQCNAGGGLTELEEAWLIRGLYRQDRQTQPQIGQLFGRHKSWVCRRLMLAESLSDAVTADLRLGLLSARAAAEMARLPRGNQESVAKVVVHRGMTSRQVARLVDRCLYATEQSSYEKVLREAQKRSGEEILPKAGNGWHTPAEQLVADSLAMKRLLTRLQVRLLERPLVSLGKEGQEIAERELFGLKDTLTSLLVTLEKFLEKNGGLQ
jgi:ParB-like chromosome segregation protein Spo0J